MSGIDFEAVDRILEAAYDNGRESLFEHECYELLEAIGAEAAPARCFVPVGQRPTAIDLESLTGDKVVLKIVSPDITHKTEARGVRIVERELEAVDAAFHNILEQAPRTYAAFLEANAAEAPSALAGLDGAAPATRLADRVVGVLLASFVPADSPGFASELFVGIRSTEEFGPIISAGLGGVDMEILASTSRKGTAVAIAPTGMVDGAAFCEVFRSTLSYHRLGGGMRGCRRLVEDAVLTECFQAFIDLANHLSAANPEARFHLRELEVNPFTIAGGRIAPLDGVCSFTDAPDPVGARPTAKIGNLLKPSSAAVIGVSERSMNMGRIILKNLFAAGFDRRRVWTVHPSAVEIDGVPCVPSVADLPQKVDLFVVAVGAAQVAGLVSELIEHDRANTVILVPGGLGEKEGSKSLEHDLKRRILEAHRSADGGPLFLGGNSLGVISHPGHYDTMFIPDSKLPKSRGERERKLCFMSQSGAFIISNISRMPWLDPVYALSIGNQIDLTVGDLLSFIKDDAEVDVFAVYMEGFQRLDGLAFAKAVRETVALGKDVVFYKAGRTSEGRSATAGHTASVAGDYAVCEAALVQAGALVASDFNEFSDLLRVALALRGKGVSSNRLAAISNAGYESVGMADSLRSESGELRLGPFSPGTAKKMQKILAEHRLDGLVDVKNPLDVTPMASDAAYAALVAAALDDETADAVVAGIVPLTPAMQTLPFGEGHRESILDPSSIANLLPQVAAASDKPLVAVVDSGVLFDALANTLQSGGLPVFRSADRAVRALARWVDVKKR